MLGVAVKSVSGQEHPFSKTDETDMAFAGFLLFFDPPKEGVKDTIQALAKLGVRLKVITGDNKLVARHTGQVVGLGDAKVLTGAELDDLRDEALWHAVEETTIFAGVDPNQKERIILALKKRGHVVGYMGDGINDAPSLHSADVGISVANAVDVAKEAADLVLLKQDLDVLREGIVQGRKTFANTLKYVFMATSANFGNMFSMAGASLFLPFLPMLPKQILLINFLTDLPEMTIASDRVDDVFVERPHRMDIKFIRRFMLIFGPLSSLFDFATFGVLLWLMKANEQSLPNRLVYRVHPLSGSGGLCGSHAPAVHAQSSQPRHAGCHSGGDADYVVAALFAAGWIVGLCAASVSVSAGHFWDRGVVLYVGRTDQALVLSASKE